MEPSFFRRRHFAITEYERWDLRVSLIDLFLELEGDSDASRFSFRPQKGSALPDLLAAGSRLGLQGTEHR